MKSSYQWFLVSYLFNEFPHEWMLLRFLLKTLQDWWARHNLVLYTHATSPLQITTWTQVFLVAAFNETFIILPKIL